MTSDEKTVLLDKARRAIDATYRAAYENAQLPFALPIRHATPEEESLIRYIEKLS